jgi:hypothetical protein
MWRENSLFKKLASSGFEPTTLQVVAVDYSSTGNEIDRCAFNSSSEVKQKFKVNFYSTPHCREKRKGERGEREKRERERDLEREKAQKIDKEIRKKDRETDWGGKMQDTLFKR